MPPGHSEIDFWTTFIGFHTTFLVQHWLGAEGMPRRYADYLGSDGFTTLNTISTVGSYILGLSMLPFLWNVFRSYRYGEIVHVNDPWGFGNSLEWAREQDQPIDSDRRWPAEHARVPVAHLGRVRMGVEVDCVPRDLGHERHPLLWSAETSLTRPGHPARVPV